MCIYFVIVVVKYLHVVVSNVTCPRAADIVLALDQSTSIVLPHSGGFDNWHVHTLGFAKSIASAFPIDKNLTQVGLLKFSSDVEIVFHLNRYGDLESLLNAIDNVDIGGGVTSIAVALRAAREVMFNASNGARNGVPKILILLTEGEANRERHKTLEEARLTKEDNIIVYTVGVTGSVDPKELREIASTPEYFFFASNFTELNNILSNLTKTLCREATTLPTTSTTTTPTTTPTTTTSTPTIAPTTTTFTPITTEIVTIPTTIRLTTRGRPIHRWTGGSVVDCTTHLLLYQNL